MYSHEVPNACPNNYKGDFSKQRAELCATVNTGSDSAFVGDYAGSPLVCDGLLAGVLVKRSVCARNKKLGNGSVYTFRDISRALNWLHGGFENTGEYYELIRDPSRPKRTRFTASTARTTHNQTSLIATTLQTPTKKLTTERLNRPSTRTIPTAIIEVTSTAKKVHTTSATSAFSNGSTLTKNKNKVFTNKSENTQNNYQVLSSQNHNIPYKRNGNATPVILILFIILFVILPCALIFRFFIKPRICQTRGRSESFELGNTRRFWYRPLKDEEI